MKTILYLGLVSTLIFAFNLIITSASTSSNYGLYPEIYRINTNKHGKTYGTYTVDEHGEFIEPDLIEVIGLGGVEGYVKKNELYNTKEQPKNPDEAVEYMKNEFFKSRVIPVYENDGTTIIGEYEIK